MKRNYIKIIIKAFKRIHCFCYGHLLMLLAYDKNYIKGKWFYGRFHGLFSQGWEWLCNDFKGCRSLNVNRDAKFPVSPLSRVVSPEKIKFDPNDMNNFQTFGCYFQALNGIEIGSGTFIGPNVGLISQNHSIYNPNEREIEKKGGGYIGASCWLGMNSIILPGVILGDHTVVGAGSVVTKSFPEGYCVIAGNPAKKIRAIEENDFRSVSK